MSEQVRPVDERRAEIQALAAAMEIDDAYISHLVDSFYHRVRCHDVLGPIFNEAIKDDWEPHLDKMKDFWASVTMNAGRYSGKPVPKHVALTNVEPHHFDIWLGLFEQILLETAPTPEAVEYFLVRAKRIAESLKLAMFGIPDLPLRE